ncbi:MAG: protein-disulfide reductase DsbD, partial [Gammaproteobacteria bacterium]|nr:protein-disulfide reductase DsbD [Gammaproteobacteria bacterium]
FPDAQVQSALQEYVFLKVDVTANDETDKNLLAQYNLVGPPALLFIDRAGTWLANRTIIGVPTPDSLAQDLGEIASN